MRFLTESYKRMRGNSWLYF